ncbi:MAG: DUF1801 domain-containing protein [Thaumarchaeota archaeon]|nr:DUF1801 domain-containing protein [Nitrososphaerota archaeon]
MPPGTVDAYIAAAPSSARPKLRAMRKAILEAAPGARESISYRIPFYDLGGRLAWFGLLKGHIGLFVRPPVLEEHKAELRGYVMTKSSLHFPLDGEVPEALVKKLVRAAARKNAERA